MIEGVKMEKGVPVPPPSKGGRAVKYPFADLQVGDSFSVPLSGEMHPGGGDMTAHRVSQAAIRRSKCHGGKFRVRTVREEGVARCWRIE